MDEHEAWECEQFAEEIHEAEYDVWQLEQIAGNIINSLDMYKPYHREILDVVNTITNAIQRGECQ